MKDIFKDLAEISEKKEELQLDDLGIVSRMIKKQDIIEGEANEQAAEELYREVQEKKISVATLEEVLKKRKRDLFQIKQVELPELMNSFGLAEFKTKDGLSVTIEAGLSVSVKDDQEFFEFLERIGYNALIKDELIIKTTGDKREEVIELLKGRDFVEKKSVHPMTLKKFVKDQMSNGAEIPASLTVHEYKIAKLRRN